MHLEVAIFHGPKVSTQDEGPTVYKAVQLRILNWSNQLKTKPKPEKGKFSTVATIMPLTIDLTSYVDSKSKDQNHIPLRTLNERHIQHTQENIKPYAMLCMHSKAAEEQPQWQWKCLPIS